MDSLTLRAGLACATLAVAAAAVHAAEPDVEAAATTAPATTSPPQEIVITAERLNERRDSIETQTGASTYTVDQAAIQAIPAADNSALNQVMLQMPDMAQDSFGQLHLRGEHANIQFRINGVILPEGLSVFGQALDPRFIGSAKLITGALPAEYGLRTAGIVDIKTRNGLLQPGGSVSLYGGSHGTFQPSFNYGGSSGSMSYFVTLDAMQSDLGIESPDGSAQPLHDHTRQYHGLGYFENILDQNDRLTVIAGISNNRFEIPDEQGVQPAGVAGVSGLGPCGSGTGFYPPATDGACRGSDASVLTANGQYAYPSAALNQRQYEQTQFGILSWQHASGDLDLHSSLMSRYSSLTFEPDPVGDLLYNGIAQYAYKRDVALAWQTDASYEWNDAHTVRGGWFAQGDRATSQTNSLVLLTDDAGNQRAPDAPQPVLDDSTRNEWLESAYLQDEWKVASQFTLNYGVRLDRVSAYTTGSQLSPRLSGVWQLPTDTIVHGGYARYLTPPPFELVGTETINKFANTTNAPGVAVADVSKMERADYYDIGVLQKLGDFTVGLDSYYKTSVNVIDEGQFGAPIILTPFNYHDGKQYGLELTTGYTAGAFSAYLNMATQSARGRNIVSSEFNFSPDDLAYISTHYIDMDHEQHFTASAGVSYAFADTRLSGDLLLGTGLRSSLVLPDGSVVPNGDHLPSYTQANLGASHHFSALGGFTLRADVINLFDKIYQIRNGTGVGVGAPQYGARRGVFGGFSKDL
jgi:outer membrane receptor protein involved in Fe transport